MIESMCRCGGALIASEQSVNTVIACPKCRAKLFPVCAETIESGAGDFDARLLVTAGPDRVGQQHFLGGIADIEIGKLSERHIVLGGTNVSRLHCKLTRLDFGPSRWKLSDNRSTNGLFVNGERVSSHELKDGDQVAIGEYTLQYETGITPKPAAVSRPATAPRPATIAPQMPGTLAYAGPPTLRGIQNQRLAARATAESGYGVSNAMLIATGVMVGLPLLILIAGKVVTSLQMPGAVLAILSAATLYLWGHIGILIVAASEGGFAVAACFFVPFYKLYFALSRLEETKMHVLRIIAAVVLCVAAMTLAKDLGA